MKARILVEIEVDVKDKYFKTEFVKSSDRGGEWIDKITTPTQQDVEDALMEQLNCLHPSASVDRFFPFVPGSANIKETTIIV